MKNILFSIVLVISVVSCQEDKTLGNSKNYSVTGGVTGKLPKANGTAGLVLVSIDNTLWQGEIENVFNNRFSDTAQGPFIYTEHVLDFIQEDPSTINRIRKKNRNFLRVIFDKNKLYTETEVVVKKNYKASGQLYVVIRDSDKARLLSFLNKELKTYITLFNLEENERLVAKYNLNKNLSFDKAAKSQFGISISVPTSAKFVANNDSIIYALDKNVDETTRDNPKTGAKGGVYWSQKGVMIWESQYENEESFNPLTVLSLRDSVLKKNVKGTIEDSYMATEYGGSHKPKIHYINLSNAKTMVIEGLWKHGGNVAASGGGPFIQYSIIHPTRQTIVHVSTHVFAPRFSKREYIRQIRAMLMTTVVID